jgi:hypothetical protein
MSERSRQLEVRNVRVINAKDVDVVVRDCYGVEHLLFPKGEKQMLVLTQREKSHGNKRISCSC